MEKSLRRKVLVYCVHEGRLLVFRHVDRSPEEVGVQVPAGTVRPDETPRRAAERELVEETGKDSFVVERFLGRAYFDASPYRPEVHERYFFLARLREPVPERWIGGEEHDGQAPTEPFEFFWIPLAAAHVLQAGQSELVGLLLDELT